MMSSGINLVMTVIGFAVSTMFIAFVCTRLICARIQLHVSRRSFQVGTRSDLSILERGLHGLEPSTIASFPTKKYSDEYFSSAENTQCTVCLADYRKEDVLRILPSCGHFFHMTCIDIWLQQHSTCPVCRMSLREFPEKKRSIRPLPRSAARLHRGEGSFSTHQYRYTMSGHGFSPRIHENRGADLTDMDYFPPQIDGAEATEICPVHGCSVTRDPRNKLVEIPSSS